jgi:hypothetical protein
LKPLAVTATTDHLSELGRKNLDNIGRLCDHVEVTPNKTIRNKIAKFALEEVGDISWCEHHLIWSIPARESIARGISRSSSMANVLRTNTARGLRGPRKPSG